MGFDECREAELEFILAEMVEILVSNRGDGNVKAYAVHSAFSALLRKASRSTCPPDFFRKYSTIPRNPATHVMPSRRAGSCPTESSAVETPEGELTYVWVIVTDCWKLL